MSYKDNNNISHPKRVYNKIYIVGSIPHPSLTYNERKKGLNDK